MQFQSILPLAPTKNPHPIAECIRHTQYSPFRDSPTPMRLEEIVTNHQSSQVLVIIAVVLLPLFSSLKSLEISSCYVVMHNKR